MSQAVIPFAGGLASGLSELSGASPVYVNFLADQAGALRVRPGIEAWDQFPEEVSNDSPVIGIFPWRSWLIFVREDRTIAAWIAPGPGGVVELSDGTAATMLDGTGRPSFAYDSERVVIVGGGVIQQWQGVGLTSRLAPAATAPDGSPLTGTNISYSAQRFVVNLNNNSGILQWSEPGPGGHTSWPIVGPFYSEAEAAPDPVVASFANTNTLWAFGTATTQIYIPDPVIAFSTGPALETGCAVGASVVSLEDGSMFWLDDKRRFVSSKGRGFDVVSDPGMTASIKALSVVSDCWGCNIMMGSHDIVAWSFPAEQRAIYYDRATKRWGEFRGLDADGDFVAWAPQSYCYWAERNMHLVGLDNGKIGILSFDAGTDMGDTILAISRPGFHDRGTFNRKLCERVDLQLKRGETAPPGPAPVVELRFRNDLGAWGRLKRFSMGAGEYRPTVTAWAQGEYVQRQYELRWSGGGGFLLAGATETYQTGDT